MFSEEIKKWYYDNILLDHLELLSLVLIWTKIRKLYRFSPKRSPTIQIKLIKIPAFFTIPVCKKNWNKLRNNLVEKIFTLLNFIITTMVVFLLDYFIYRYMKSSFQLILRKHTPNFLEGVQPIHSIPYQHYLDCLIQYFISSVFPTNELNNDLPNFNGLFLYR